MDNGPVAPRQDAAGEAVKVRFYNFLTSFVTEDDIDTLASQGRIRTLYEEQIVAMIRNDRTTVYVDFAHINDFDRELAEAIQLEYYRFEPFLRRSVQEYVGQEHPEYVHDMDKGTREFFVSVHNLPRVERIRNMRTETIGRLISFSGTVTRSSEVRPELLFGTYICRKCSTMATAVEQQCTYTEPQVCRNNNCPSQDFQILMDQCVFVDWQRLRVQENADEIPAGSMPRSIDVICRNDVVESAKAGDKVIFTGSVMVLPDSSGLATAGEGALGVKSSKRVDNFSDGVQGLKRIGVREMTYKMLFIACSVQQTDQRFSEQPRGVNMDLAGDQIEGDVLELSEADKEDILNMKNSSKLYIRMTESICPSVFGHPEVKRGILLMLFGGVHKTTPEGISLRGDINVCIVGDPSCAKSQFLKYVHNFLPRSVYTSGKASSAAGLTASVVKDSETGEYCVEAGALMLADNGICCIDEFDKMDPNDQVAIHEAMEQQTISITKAGIQATLNARTSILAAANPVFGRYDRSKTLKANVAISAAIMSRFDLFFVILDECNPKVDEAIARHIVAIHRPGGTIETSRTVPFTTDQLRKYIKFARRLNPLIEADGKKVLVECYRALRQNDMLGKNKTAYRITVRQLESLIRLSEALARLHLDDKVRPNYIREACRLLQQSIIFVEMEDIELEEGDEPDGDAAATVDNEYNDETTEQQMNGHTELPREPDGSPHPAGAKRKSNDDGNDESSVGREDQGTVPDGSVDGGDSKRRRKEKKIKTQLPYHEYRSMTQFIAIHLREEEEKGGSDFPGCKWGDLVAWYLLQFQRDLTSDEEFEKKRKLISQVLRRMLKHEESLIEVGNNDDNIQNEDRVLKLHPSYEIA